MAAVQTDLIVNARSVNMARVQSEVSSLYRTSQVEVAGLTTQVQRFGHHSFATFAIFKGLAIYRGFGLLTQQLAEGVQKAIEFQKSMANVNSLLQVGQDELREYGDFAAQLGQQLPLTMNAIAEGLYDIVSAGILAKNEIMDVATLAGTAAVAGVTELRISVQAGIGTMNAFGKTVEDLEHIYDVHFMTVKMGILTYEQLAQVMGRVSASAALAGQQMETANAALVAISRGGFGGVAFREGSTRVVRFFQELSDPATHQRLRELGVVVFDSFGKMRNAIDVVADMQAKLAMMTDEAANAVINQTFTNIRSAQGFQVLSTQIDIWREAQMRAIFSAGAMESAAAKQVNTVAAMMIRLQNQFTDAMRGMISGLAPILDRIGKIFAAMGKNLVPVIMMIGTLAMRFVAAGIAGKYLNAVMLRQSLQVDVLMLSRKRENLQSQLSVTTTKIATLQKGAETVATRNQINAAVLRRAAIEGNIIATKAEMATAALRIKQMQYQRYMTIGNVVAIMGMTGALYAMSTGNKLAAQVLIGFTVALQTITAIMPVVISLIGAKTSAMTALATANWNVAAASAAATGGISAVGAAAGVAIVIGVMAGALTALSIASMGAEEEVQGLSDTFDEFADEQADLEDDVRKLVDSLIDEGKSLGYITDEVERFARARRGLGAVGAEALAGLATQRFAMIGGTAVVAPRVAGTEAAEQALASLGFTHGEFARMVKGDVTLIDQVQSKLLDLIGTEDEFKTIIAEQYATDIFGTKFGQSLITLWDDYGQRLQIVGGEQSEFFSEAQQAASEYADTIRRQVLVETENWYKTATKTVAVRHGFPVGPLGYYTTEQRPYSEEEKQAEYERRLAESEYHEVLKVVDQWMAIGDIAQEVMEEVAMTIEEAFEAIQENVEAWAEGLGDVMKIEDMIETMIGAGDQLDAAGFYFGDVAGNWEALGEKWAQIQKMWMGLQMMQTLMGVVDSLVNLPEEIATEMRPVYEPIYEEHRTLAAMMARMKLLRTPFGMVEFQRWQQGKSPLRELSEEMLVLFKQAMETKTVQVGEELVGYEPITTEVANEFAQLRVDIYNALLPVFGQLGPELAGSLAGLLGTLLGDLGQPGFWDALFEDTEEAVVETIEEMAGKFIDTIRGAGGFSDAIESFVEHGAILEDAGYYFKEVASGWEMLGEEWARIQTYFKVSEMINAFIQSAKAMEEYGVTLPAQFQENMFSLMQVMATQVLPDFQNVIDELIGSIGSADFWDALAKGMAEAQITQSNTITLAPYIVISERADAEEIMQLIHDSLVEEAKRAGFTWGGG